MDPAECEGLLRSPIILVGRGGSGTRVLSEIVRSLGVFLGNEINASGDSVEWVETIYDLACTQTSRWLGDTKDESASARLRICARNVLSAGLYRHGPWGWKLPETVIALPSVLRAFPEPRIIHLVRHPITSAFRRTHMTSRTDNRVGASLLPVSYRAIGRSEQLISTDDIVLHNAITWLFQTRSAVELFSVSAAPVLLMTYEEICEDISCARQKVANFLSIDPKTMHWPLPNIDWGRTIELTVDDPRVEEVWSLCKAVATELGYTRYGRR